MDERRIEAGGDPGHSDALAPVWQGDELPDDARALGLDRNTEEGAWVHFASSLDSSRPLHKVVAWVLIFALLGAPALLQVLGWLGLIG